MKSLCKIISIAALLHIGYAYAESVSLPSVAGPEIYQLHTDARMLHTRVFVNEIELELDDTGGIDSVTIGNKELHGQMGYPSNHIINAYLKPGKNNIRVEYSSPLLQSAKDDAEKRAYIFQEMYSHTILTRGRLHDSSSGIISYYLDEAIKVNQYNAEILSNSLELRFDENKFKHSNFSYKLQLPENTHFVQASLSECYVKVYFEDGLIFGTLSLNGENSKTINYASQTTLSRWQDLLKDQSNRAHLTVKEIISSTETTDNSATSQVGVTAKLKLLCNMKRAASESGLVMPEYSVLADYFDSRIISLGAIKIKNPGEYTSDFTLLF